MSSTAPYRPVSPLAVAAVVAGGFSALALIGPFFWAVPLVAVGLACAALADVGREGAAKAGRLAALAGLALAIGFGSQAVAARVTSRWILATRARAAARAWLEAIQQQRLADARGMCHPAAAHAVAAVTAVCDEGGPQAEVLSVEPGVDPPTGWEVRARIGPCGRSPATDVRLVLAPQVTSVQGRVVERWLVESCEPVR